MWVQFFGKKPSHTRGFVQKILWCGSKQFLSNTAILSAWTLILWILKSIRSLRKFWIFRMFVFRKWTRSMVQGTIYQCEYVDLNVVTFEWDGHMTHEPCESKRIFGCGKLLVPTAHTPFVFRNKWHLLKFVESTNDSITHMMQTIPLWSLYYVKFIFSLPLSLCLSHVCACAFLWCCFVLFHFNKYAICIRWQLLFVFIPRNLYTEKDTLPFLSRKLTWRRRVDNKTTKKR